MPFFRWLTAVFRQWVAGVTGGVLTGSAALHPGSSGVTVPPRVHEIFVALTLLQGKSLAPSSTSPPIVDLHISTSLS
jgi:hypothetical protein